MTRIHILSPGFETPNARAFLYPFIAWRNELREAGLDCRLMNCVDASLADCDALLVDSKFHRDWWEKRAAAAMEQFRGWAGKCRVIYCDTTDSSGWLQAELLPVVHVYAKAQLLKDRSAYLKPMYAHRPFADHYHRSCKVDDAEPEWSKPVTDPRQLVKLRVSWNSGLTDHSLYGPLRGEVYRRVPLPFLVRFPREFTPPAAARPQPVACRFGISYPRASVGYQRQKIRDLAKARIDTAKIGRRAYFRELRRSKVVVSPFGYGEITLKDFEVFLTGGLLFKPDMGHMETWPNLFAAGETILVHGWDLSDFNEKLDAAISRHAEYLAIATEGQARYRRHIAGPDAPGLFIAQLRRVIG